MIRPVFETATSSHSYALIYSEGPFGLREMRNLAKTLNLIVEWWEDDKERWLQSSPLDDDCAFWANQSLWLTMPQDMMDDDDGGLVK